MWWTVVLDSIDQFILFLSTLYSRKHLLEAAHAGLHLRGGSRCSLAGEWLLLQLRGAATPTASRSGSSKAQQLQLHLGGPAAPTASRRSGGSHYSLKLRNRHMAPLSLVSASQILTVAVVAPCRRWHLFWLCGSLVLLEAGYFPRQGRLQQAHGGRRCCSGLVGKWPVRPLTLLMWCIGPHW